MTTTHIGVTAQCATTTKQTATATGSGQIGIASGIQGIAKYGTVNTAGTQRANLKNTITANGRNGRGMISISVAGHGHVRIAVIFKWKQGSMICLMLIVKCVQCVQIAEQHGLTVSTAMA